MGPSLTAAGKKGDGNPKAVSAGDGSEAAYQRIRTRHFQAGTDNGYRDQYKRIWGN